MRASETDTLWAALSALASHAGRDEAILAPGRTPLRFADLAERLVDVRAGLHQLGLGRRDRIASALPQGADTAVCFFAVAACATYVPLNPEYTEDEFVRYLSRIRPSAVIVPAGDGQAMRGAASRLGVRVLELRCPRAGQVGAFELVGAEAEPCTESGWAGDDDVALILLTSGTTSRPKLVPLKQRHLLAIARAGKAFLGLSARDRYLHTSPMFHGHGLKSGLTMPVLAGSSVICGDRFDASQFFATLSSFRPTWYSATYTMQRAILDRFNDYRGLARDAPLRFIVSGSGPLDPKLALKLEAAFDVPLLDRYSMSETGALTCNPLPPRTRKPGTVGVPMLNEIRIVDEAGNALPPGAQGEIVARGPSVFDGYLDDPKANADAFRDGWFRTGDCGRVDDDGYLTITGRIKELINRGGEKIAPLEVETVLGEHPAVAEACVFGVTHPTLGETVAAAVVPSNAALVSERSIIDFAEARLAGFKVPRRILFTASLPQSATGKVDRSELARQFGSLAARPVKAEEDVRSPLEVDVAALWQALLDTPSMARNVDFFEAGGDSLKAAELFVEIRRRFGVSIGMQHILDEGSTIAGLARLIERAGTAPGRTALPQRLLPIKSGGDRSPLFAIPGSDGNPGAYVHFGRLLDPRQPLYGLASRGLYGEASPISKLEDIAADHVTTLRALQPCGPYFLIGACFGGRVAYEMARQLEAVGQRVAFLGMLDPSPPFTDSSGRPRGGGIARPMPGGRMALARFLAQRLRMYAREFARLRGTARMAFLREKLYVLREIVLRRDPFRGDRSELQGVAVRAANDAAGRAYIPRAYGGRATLVLTDGRPKTGPRNYRLDWLDLMPQCGVPRYLPGRDTGDMLIPPNVYALARHVNAWLDEAHAAGDASTPIAPPRLIAHGA